MGASMAALVRYLLLIVVLIVCIWVVAAHGVRGVAFLVIFALLITVPRTRAWAFAERRLVRLTGSRRRAAALVMGTIIVILLVVNVYPYIH